MMKSERL